MTEKTITEILTDAGWTQGLSNGPTPKEVEESLTVALITRGWKPPQVEWDYRPATTQHKHSWACSGDTLVGWSEMVYYQHPGGGTGELLMSTTVQHRHGPVELRMRWVENRTKLFMQLGYWPNVDDRNSEDFVVTSSRYVKL